MHLILFNFIKRYPTVFRVEHGTWTAWTNADSDIVLIKYADKKNVHLLTTVHPNTENLADGKRKPTTVVSCNRNIGGVNRADQVSDCNLQ